MPPDWDSADVAVIRAEALDVLKDALQWQLTETRWPAIEQVLAAMHAAVTDRDPDALMAATADLELAGPLRTRATRIGAPPLLPAPPKVLERLNRLVFTLGGVPAATGEDPGQAAEDGATTGGSSALGHGRGGAHGQPYLGQ
jgi:hypothetical protein